MTNAYDAHLKETHATFQLHILEEFCMFISYHYDLMHLHYSSLHGSWQQKLTVFGRSVLTESQQEAGVEKTV